MNQILTRKTQFGKKEKDGKSRNYVLYFLNNELLLKQKYPFDPEKERGYDVKTSISGEYIFNGRMYQMRRHVDTHEIRQVSFPVSQMKLKKHGVSNDIKITLTKTE
jgi:hypothetical protein